jgi:tetratricopeptide (TPR) repeat protein
MQAKIRELQQALTGFLRQSRRSVLVLALEDTELVYVLKLLQTMDQQDRAHVYGLFPQAADKSSSAYVGEVVKSLSDQLDEVNQDRVRAGNPPWSPMSPACTDMRLAPTQRLRAAILYARSVVPNNPDNRLVFSLLPQRMDSPEAFAEAVSSLLPSPGSASDAAWAGIRLILRDDKMKPVLIPELRRQKNASVLVYEPDLSPAALMDSMARDALDPNLSEGERMQTLGQLAAIDYSYGRLEEAAAKYGVLYEYYSRHKAPVMQALVLQGIGDVLRRAGNLPLARERYAQGLTHALETQALPLMLSLSYNVGDTSLALHNWADADGHLDIARTIAGQTLNPHMQADAMEKMGMARLEQKSYAEAAAIWNEGAEVCRGCDYRDRLCSILERLAALYASARRVGEQGACEAELRAVRAGAPLVRKYPVPQAPAPSPSSPPSSPKGIA